MTRASIVDEVLGDPSNNGHIETRRVALTAAADIQPRPVRWLWKDRVALGTLALVGGREGVGKSMVTYQLAADITQGRLPGVHRGRPRSVIVAATEDSWEHTIVPRLMAAGADLTKLFRVDVTTSEGVTGSLSLPRDLTALAAHIKAVGAVAILLDPLISRLDANLDTHKDAEVRLALEPLVALADQCGIAVVGLIHVNKSITTDPLTMLMASRAFAAVARAVLFVTKDPDDDSRRLFGQPKNNLGRTDLPTLAFSITSTKVADTSEGEVWTGKVCWGDDDPRQIGEVLRAGGQDDSDETRSATQDAAGWLADYLSIHHVAESQRAKTEGKHAGHPQRTLERARAKIGAGVMSHGFPRRSHWSKPGMTPDEVERWLTGQSGAPVAPAPGETTQYGVTGGTGGTEPRSTPVAPVAPSRQDPTRDGATGDGTDP